VRVACHFNYQRAPTVAVAQTVTDHPWVNQFLCLIKSYHAGYRIEMGREESTPVSAIVAPLTPPPSRAYRSKNTEEMNDGATNS
jgi:hypothetical protein